MTDSAPATTGRSPESLFKSVLIDSILPDSHQRADAGKLPLEYAQSILEHNFGGDPEQAKRVMLNQQAEIEAIDHPRLAKIKDTIPNLGKASEKVADYINGGNKILFLTDNDNDGSSAQAVLTEFKRLYRPDVRQRMLVEFAQPISDVRGIGLDMIDLLADHHNLGQDEKFLIVTADNGINNRDEVIKIRNKYPNAEIIITDHHLPTEDVVVENDAVTIFNPKYSPNTHNKQPAGGYFAKHNISGANALGVLLEKAAAKSTPQWASADLFDQPAVERTDRVFSNMRQLGRVANLLDYAHATVTDMPTNPDVYDLALSERPNLNVSNSMSQLGTKTFTGEDYDNFLAVANDTSDPENAISATQLAEEIRKVVLLQEVARRYLSIWTRIDPDLGGDSPDLVDVNGSRKYQDVRNEALAYQNGYKTANPDYIGQLRPVILNALFTGDKDPFTMALVEDMRGVFTELKAIEKNLQTILRNHPLMDIRTEGNSTIIQTKDRSEAVVKMFNRKFLSKAYNTENRGFILMISDRKPGFLGGSMRSLYPISELLEGKEDMEKALGIKVEFQGHEQAAGFFITSTNGKDVSDATLDAFNTWMNDRCDDVQARQRVNRLPTIEADFDTLEVMRRMNNSIKGNLAGMLSIRTMLNLQPRHGDVWVSDHETGRQLKLSEVAEKKNYGYISIKTDFHGGAIILPVELVKAVVKSGFTKGVQLDYMNEGVFMATQALTIDRKTFPNLVRIKGNDKGRDQILGYYTEHYHEGKIQDVSRDELKDSPFIKLSRKGEQEFDAIERLYLNIMDNTAASAYHVLDIEATGLGSAPKLFNAGILSIVEDMDAAEIHDLDAFNRVYFRGGDGAGYMLTEKQLSSLKPLDPEKGIPDGHMLIHDADAANPDIGGTPYTIRIQTGRGDQAKVIKLKTVSNLKYHERSGKVVVNRRIKGKATSVIVREDDFAITPEIKGLTGMDQDMLDAYGMTAAEADRHFINYFSGFKDRKGEDAKHIIAAHNATYDLKGFKHTLPESSTLIEKDFVLVDTAKIARVDRLAYDSTPVVKMAGTGTRQVYFYDSPYSEFSFSNFIDKCAEGNDGHYPDINGRYVMKYDAGDRLFTLLDEKTGVETTIDAENPEDLRPGAGTFKMVPADPPAAGIKYSVEALARKSMVRNILLDQGYELDIPDFDGDEQLVGGWLNWFAFNYNFNSGKETNIRNFIGVLGAKLLRDGLDEDLMFERVESLGNLLPNFTEKFLEQNREIAARHHDGWTYAKIIKEYDPDVSRRITPEVVEQIKSKTHLPGWLVRKGLTDIKAFEKKHGIRQIIVEELHNNLDNRGDNWLEGTLVAQAALAQGNSYQVSGQDSSDHWIRTNAVPMMKQRLITEPLGEESAADSFSGTQKLSGYADRTAVAEAVRREVYKEESGYIDGATLKLSDEDLPEGSIIRVQPKEPVSRKELLEDRKKIKEAVIMLQIIHSAKGADESVALMTKASEEKILELRDQLVGDNGKYSDIQLARDLAQLGKITDMMQEAMNHGTPSSILAKEPIEVVPPSVAVTEESIALAKTVGRTLEAIYDSTGTGYQKGVVNAVLEHMDRVLNKDEEAKAVTKRDSTLSRSAGTKAGSVDIIRTENFFQEFSAARRDPIAFGIKQAGYSVLYPHIENAIKDPQPRPMPKPPEEKKAKKAAAKKATKKAS